MEKLKEDWTIDDIKIGSVLYNKQNDKAIIYEVVGKQIFCTINNSSKRWVTREDLKLDDYCLVVDESIGKPYNENDLLSITDSENIKHKEPFNNTFKSDLQFKLEYLKELNVTYKRYIESNRLIGSDLIASTINALIKEISELQK